MRIFGIGHKSKNIGDILRITICRKGAIVEQRKIFLNKPDADKIYRKGKKILYDGKFGKEPGRQINLKDAKEFLDFLEPLIKIKLPAILSGKKQIGKIGKKAIFYENASHINSRQRSITIDLIRPNH